MMLEFQSLEQLTKVMVKAGVKRLYAKSLAANDNSKNQVYLASGFAVLNQLPAFAPLSQAGQSTLWADLNFAWLMNDGSTWSARHAKLVLYPQYPEVRLSGFLQGCIQAPNDQFNIKKHGRSVGRILFLGVTSQNQILASLAPAGTRLASEVLALKTPDDKKTLLELPLASERDSRTLLINELTRIHHLGWIASKGLRSDGSIQACRSPNCVGYTLEAELGVARNGRSEPDFQGWEIKASQVADFSRPPNSKAQTLFTPEPTGGFYKSEGVEAFIREFGYPDRQGRADRLNFGGIFRNRVRAPLTGLTLTIDGFDEVKAKITDPNGAVVLLDDRDRMAASWSFSALLALWSRKHAKAAYVPAEKSVEDWSYRYGSIVRLATGTDFLLLLKAISTGFVYYDPGIKLEDVSTALPKPKRRSQFRISSKNLSELYHKIEFIDLNA